MALPSSGTITTEQIRAEFGGSLPFVTSDYYRGGGLVPNTTANASVPTSGQMTIPDDFYGASAESINISNHTVTGESWQETNDEPPPATFTRNPIRTILVLNTGVLRGQGSISGTYPDGGLPSMTTTNYAGQWLGGGSASDYECRWTTLTGTLITGSATGVWLNCGTTRSWTNSQSGSASGTLAFRPAGGGAVLDSATITLN